MRKGISTAVLLYSAGIIATAATYFVSASFSLSGPPAAFMVAVFFVMIGLFRIFKMSYRMARGIDVQESKGELIVHLAVFILLAIAATMMVRSTP